MRGAAGVIAIVASLLAGAPSAFGQEPPGDRFYGVVAQGALDDSDLERMAGGGVGTLRVTLEWARVDSAAVPSGYDWSDFDELVATASRQGISVLPVIFTVPHWVSVLERCD